MRRMTLLARTAIVVAPMLVAAPSSAAQASMTGEERGRQTVADAIKALDGQRAPGRPVPIGNPGQWFGPVDYPLPALRAGEQGRVVAMVGVDAAGRVTGCTVAQSSGSASLDAATCRIAQAKISFRPARDAAGHAVAGEYRLPIVWRLPANTVPAATMMTTLVSIGPDGAVLSCTSQSVAALPDLCAAFPKGQKLPGLDAMRGKVMVMATVMRPLAE